jgi:hypothetical protein
MAQPVTREELLAQLLRNRPDVLGPAPEAQAAWERMMQERAAAQILQQNSAALGDRGAAAVDILRRNQ